MTPQELKNSIIQLAMRGKLVEQISAEGSGIDLLQSIESKKTVLGIKEKKNINEITEDDIPFDIPDTWTWTRFGSIVTYNMGKTPPRSESQWWSNGFPWVSIADMPENGHIVSTKEQVSSLAISEKFGNRISKAGTMLMSFKLTVGRVSILDIDAVHNEAIISIYPLCDIENTIQHYLFYLLPTITQYGDTRSAIKGKTLNDTSISNLLIPLPPLAEQKRIVAKIEELLPLIDRYEAAWTKLESFNKRFPMDMQKSLLQMAIQGKLVEQRPEEGTGEELYNQIQAEKQALIKTGKIKKDKPLPEITVDEIPFDIPDTWRWCCVGDIFDHNTGKAMNASAKRIDKPGSIRKFITTSNLYWDSFDFTTVKEMFFSADELARCTATKNDILMCEGGAYYGRTAIWNYDYDICFQNHVHRLRSYAPIVEKFYYYIFRLYRDTGRLQAKGTAMPGLSSVVLHHMIVPLPPLAEQKRIVAKLEELLPLCDKLK